VIQVQEKAGLGAGQEIETEMAKQVRLKVFPTTETLYYWFDTSNFHPLPDAIKACYKSGRTNMDMQIIHL